MDFEVFVYNRTTRKTQSIFKAIGDAGKFYCTSYDSSIIRRSNNSTALSKDIIKSVAGLSVAKVKQLCSENVWWKGRRICVGSSSIILTQVYPLRNCIRGEVASGTIYDQVISWGRSGDIPLGLFSDGYTDRKIEDILNERKAEIFDLASIVVYCDCKYFEKHTRESGFC